MQVLVNTQEFQTKNFLQALKTVIEFCTENKITPIELHYCEKNLEIQLSEKDFSMTFDGQNCMLEPQKVSLIQDGIKFYFLKENEKSLKHEETKVDTTFCYWC